MELALGLKITKTRDDIASISEYQLAKDKGLVFQSRETNTMFILSAYLNGYKRNDVDIKISKDGSKISISGKKPIQEMLMMGWVIHRKQVEITGFNRVFKIPEGVNLDKIRAKYDEEEWSLNIFMPKLVKGICGVRIEEVKQEESEERGRAAQEKSETDNAFGSVGETSQKGSKEFEVQGMEGSESFMEKGGVSDKNKMLDDANREINRERKQNKVESSKLGIEDENGESLTEKVGKEGHEVMKTSEQEKFFDVCVPQKLVDTSQDKESEVQNLKESGNVEKKEGGVFDKMLDDAEEDITGDTGQKVIEETMLGVEDAKVKGMRERDREAAFEAMKTSEIEQDVGAGTPQKIGDKESDIGGMKEDESYVEKKEKMVSDNMLYDANGNINEEKQRGETKSNVEKMDTEETRMINRAKSLTEEDTYGESKQNESGDPKYEAEDRVKERVEESSMERLEEMKTSEHDETVADHIPSNIVGVSLAEELKESRIQEMEKTESTEGKIDGGVSQKMPFEANRETQKTIFGDAIQKKIVKPKIKTEGGDQECLRDKVGKEGFDAVITLCEEFPNKLPKDTHQGSEGLDVTKLKEAKDVKEEMLKRKGKEIEYFVEKGEGEGLKEMHGEAKKNKTEEIMQEETKESQNGSKDRGPQQVHENTGKGRFDASNSVTEELPKQVGGQDGSKGFKVAKTEELEEVIKEAMAETEALMEKVEGEASNKRTEEVIEKSTVTETLQKETEHSKIKRKDRDKPHAGVFVVKEPKTQRKENDQCGLQEEMSKGRFLGNKVVKEEFPTKIVDLPANTREGLQDTKIEAAEAVKEGLVKQKSEEKMEKTDYVKEEGAEIEQVVKKVKGEKFEKIQVEEDGGLRKDITMDTTHEETEEEKTQQCLQEEMRKGRYEASTTARKFPMQIADTLAKTREGSKDKEIEESEEVKGDVAKRMSGETKVVESTTKGKNKDSKIKRITQTLQETPEEKHPEALEIRTPERELQSTKVAGKGSKEVEQGSAKDKRQKTKLLPPTIQSNETHESNTESVNQGTLKSEKLKDVAETQYTYDKEITKEIANVEDQGDKPSPESWFPSTQQSKVDENDKLDEGSTAKHKASLQSQKEDSTKEMQSSIEMKENQESKQTLKPIPLEKPHRKGGLIIKGELHRGQKDRETMQEENEERETKSDDRDQQYVLVDCGKVVVKVPTIENETPKKDYVADASPIAEPERMETKRGLKESLEIEERTVEKVTNEKPRIQEETLKADTRMVDKAKSIPESLESTHEKEHPRKSEVDEKEAESLEAMSSLPSVLKTEIEELQQKELSKGHVPESIDKAQYGYDSEDTKATKIAAYQEQLLKQDHGEETTLKKRKGTKFAKSEEAKEASRQLLKKERGKSAEEMKPKVNEITPEFENKGGEDITKDEFHRGQKHKETVKEETEEAKIKIDDRDQQYMPTDFGNLVAKVPTVEHEMPKKEYLAGIASPIAEPERMETNVDEKPRIHEEILKADAELVDKAKCVPESMKTTQEKEHPIKSEALWKESESSEAITLLPSIESVGVEDAVQQKELSPVTPEMKSKEPLDLEKPMVGWKFRKRKGHVPVPESGEREQYGYGAEDIKAEKIAAYQEDLLKQDHGEETVLEKRKGSKFAEGEEAKDASRQSLKRERVKTTQTAEEKKPKMKEITPQFEKTSGFKQVAEKMHETGNREHQRESNEVTSKMGLEYPTTMEISPNKEVERNEPRELSRTSTEDEIPMKEEAQQEKEEERLVHALELEATTSKEEELAQATKNHSNAKSNVGPKVYIDKPKKSFQSTEGTTASDEVADKGAGVSKFASSSSTQQQFEVEEKDKRDANHEVGNQGSQETKGSKIDFQEATKSKTDQEVDQIENLQPQSPADQQCINKDQEEKHGIHEIEEEKSYEQRDEACGEDFQILEEQKECKEEASGGKKETKWSQKLFVPLVIAGTTLLVSLVLVFVRHRRAKKI